MVERDEFGNQEKRMIHPVILPVSIPIKHNGTRFIPSGAS
jgi:hypothetical protein